MPFGIHSNIEFSTVPSDLPGEVNHTKHTLHIHHQRSKHTANMAPIFKIATFLSRTSPSPSSLSNSH
jgi:hypothetical protein